MLRLRWLVPVLLVAPIAMGMPHETTLVTGRAALLVDEPRVAPSPPPPAEATPADDGIGLVVSHLVQPPPTPPTPAGPGSSYGPWPPPASLESTSVEDGSASGEASPVVGPPGNVEDPASGTPGEGPPVVVPNPPPSADPVPSPEPAPVPLPGPRPSPEPAPEPAPGEGGSSGCFLICLVLGDGWLW